MKHTPAVQKYGKQMSFTQDDKERFLKALHEGVLVIDDMSNHVFVSCGMDNDGDFNVTVQLEVDGHNYWFTDEDKFFDFVSSFFNLSSFVLLSKTAIKKGAEELERRIDPLGKAFASVLAEAVEFHKGQ